VDFAGKMEGNVFKLSMEMYGCRVSLPFQGVADIRWSRKLSSMY